MAVWLALVAIPIGLGGMGISWDALNHHFYLGWTAERSRFDRDLLAASYQVFQFPYLYWPAYKLASLGFSGVSAGVVLASLHATAAPALWLIARSCMPGSTVVDAVMRALAVVLGFLSIVVLSLFDSTSNDLLAAIPLLWAVATALLGVDGSRTARGRLAWVAVSGVLTGLAVAAKLSNGPLAVVGPVLWVLAGVGWSARARAVALGCAAAAASFLLSYGHWGWQLWLHVGNPVYPFGDAYFDLLRRWVGWHP
jgi:hypothetical protein